MRTRLSSAAISLAFGFALVWAQRLTLQLVFSFVVLSLSVLAYRRLGRASAPDRKPWQQTDRVVLWVLRGFVPTVALGVQSELLMRAGLAVLGLTVLLFGPRIRRPNSVATLLLLWLLIAGLTLARNSGYRSNVAICAVAALVVVAVSSTTLNRREISAAVIDSLAIFLGVNVVSYFALGMRSAVDTATLVTERSAVGFFGTRVIFPFSKGFTESAGIAATYVVGVACLGAPSRGLRALATWVGVALAFVVIAATNARVSLLAAAVVITFVYAGPRLFTKVAPALVFAAFLLPIWWPGLQSVVAPAVLSTAHTVGFFDRGEEATQFLTLNNRTEVWAGVVANYQDQPVVNKAIGYGAEGQRKSGASLAYAHLFHGYVRDPTRISAHSSVLQDLLDGGMVGTAGLTLVLGGVVLAFSRNARLSRVYDRASLMGLGCTLALAVSAATEASLAPGQNQQGVWVFVMIATVATSAPARMTSADRLGVST